MARNEHIECPSCGAKMEVAWYYYESDPDEQPYVDWEVYVENADCECELTPTQQVVLLEHFMERAADGY